MTERHRASIVLVTHNRRDELVHTLRRLTAAGDPPPIVVCDNGSSDGTARAVAEEFPRVELCAVEGNLGAVGRNVAVRRVRTSYVAFCDDDTWWEPAALTKAADLLDRFPGLASVTARCLVEPGGAEDPITDELRHSPVSGPWWMPGPALLGIMAGLTMIRVSAFWQVGGFSSRLWLGGEEELLALDLAARGWWMCWAGDAVVHHRPSVARGARQRRVLGIRNTVLTAWLRRPVSTAARHTMTVLRGAPRDAATARAIGQAVRGAGWVAKHRRVVPGEVERDLRLLETARKGSTARRYVG